MRVPTPMVGLRAMVDTLAPRPEFLGAHPMRWEGEAGRPEVGDSVLQAVRRRPQPTPLAR